jgi:hypothetical protein
MMFIVLFLKLNINTTINKLLVVEFIFREGITNSYIKYILVTFGILPFWYIQKYIRQGSIQWKFNKSQMPFLNVLIYAFAL